MVETVPASGLDATNMYETVLEAPTERRDEEMITRLLGVPNVDLVAYDARYHMKKCWYPRYLNAKCIAKTFEKAHHTTKYKELIRQIIHEDRDAIVIENEMFPLSSFRS